MLRLKKVMIADARSPCFMTLILFRERIGFPIITIPQISPLRGPRFNTFRNLPENTTAPSGPGIKWISNTI